MRNIFKIAGQFEKKLAQENVDLTPLSELLAYLRAALIINQTHHWQTSGPSFYADHLLFERLYDDEDDEVEDLIDAVAERAVGLDSIDRVDAVEQCGKVFEIVKDAYNQVSGNTPSDMVKRSLFIEQQVMKAIENCRNTISIEGVTVILDEVGDLHETFIYLLKQRNTD